VKRHATTIVLLLATIGLSIWLWCTRDSVSESERSRRSNNVFAAWRRDEVSLVEISHEGETIVLERDARPDGPWRMTSPRKERCDQAAIERMLTTLEFAAVVRKTAPPGSHDEEHVLGLDSPRAFGSVHMGSLTIRFALGAPSPRPEGSSYFRVDDGAPFVASKELTDTLLASSDTYRDRTVVPYLSLEMARFEVSHPGGGFTVERSDERSFKVGGTNGILASRDALDKAWGALAEMRAESFPKDADADRLTASPRLTIRITPKDAGKAAAELVAGDACPGRPNDVVVLRKQPTRVAACAPKGAIDALVGIGPTSLVDRKLFSFRHDEIEELRLERLSDVDAGGAPRAIEIARRGKGFHEREPADRELSDLETDAANDLLAFLADTGADEVLPGGGPFTAAFRARVRSGEHDETVELDASGTVVRRTRDDARLKVGPALARRLRPRATSLRSPVILGETRKVTRVNLRCGVAQELADDGAGLKLKSPAGYETDASILQLVDGILKGKALAWVADADDGSFGVGECRAVLSFEDGNAPATVRFGAEGEGGYYAVVDGRPEVFVAPVSLHTLASRLFVSRSVLRADPSRIESVKVELRGRPISGDPGALRAAAAGLVADHAVSVGSNDVGSPDVEIEIALAEAGTPKRVACAPASEGWRRCAASDVKAIFDVQASLVAKLLGVPDASADAR
jgi:hypothetical protein